MQSLKVEFIKILNSKSNKRVVILQDKSQQDTPIQNILQGQKIHSKINVEHIWLSSESFHEVLTGVEFPDKEGKHIVTKSPFIRSLEKLKKYSDNNQYGVIVLENAQILSAPQRDELGIFLSDLQDGFLQYQGKVLKLSLKSLILIRTRDSFPLQSWKFSKQTPIHKQSTQNKDRLVESQSSSNKNFQYKVVNIQGKLHFQVIDKNCNKPQNIPLSKCLVEKIENEKMLKCSQINDNISKIKRRLNYFEQIQNYFQKVMVYSLSLKKIDEFHKYNYPQGPIKNLVNFVCGYVCEGFAQLGEQLEKDLRDKLLQVWEKYNLKDKPLDKLQSVKGQFNLSFRQFIKKQEVYNAIKTLKSKCNIQIQRKDKEMSIAKQSMEKFFFNIGFIPTPQSLKILSKCQEVIQNNEIFLVLIGPTGVGKTHVPKIYSLLTNCQRNEANKLQVSKDKYASIAFHRGKDESELQGNFTVDKNGNLKYFSQTTFKKIVQNGGVILLSQLNTVVKNNDAILAWWLKQIENAKPDQNGDRVIELQSVPTHSEKLEFIRIKKGTLIVVDINTKDYLGRASLPTHFSSKNRLVINPLVSTSNDEFIVNSQIEILAKYIEIFWDEVKSTQLKVDQLSEEKINNWNKERTKRLQKYKKYAHVLRDIVVAYQKGEFGQLSEEEKNQGKHNKWNFSIRQIRRIIEDIRSIQQKNLNEESFQYLYEHLALRWKGQQDRTKIKEILARSLNLHNVQVKIDPKLFFQRNLIQNRRTILWAQNPSNQSAQREINKLKLGFELENIHCYKMSHQVGQFQLLGGEVPCNNSQQQQKHASLGVLTNWLQKHNKSQEKLLLILQNVDKMDAGSISMLNNFLQDYQNQKLYFNGKQYQIPKNGMILMIVREEVNWSAAENSRVVYFRYQQSKSNIILQKANRLLSQDQFSEVLEMKQIIKKEQLVNFKNDIKFPKTIIQSYLSVQLKSDLILNYLQVDKNLKSLLNKIIEFIKIQKQNLKQWTDQRKVKQKEIDENNSKLHSNNNTQQSIRIFNIGQELKGLKIRQQKFKQKINELDRLYDNAEEEGMQQQQIEQLLKDIQNKKSQLNKIQQEQRKLQRQKIQLGKLQKEKNSNIKKQDIIKLNQQKRKEVEALLNKSISKILSLENGVNQQCEKQLKNIKSIDHNNKELIKYQSLNNKVYLHYNDRPYLTNFKEPPSEQRIQKIKQKMELTPELARVLQLILIAFQQNKTVYLQGKAGVGKTKLTEFIATLLNFNCFICQSESGYHVFQMSANVELGDLIGGLEIKYEGNKRLVTINRQTALIKLIKRGGIFVLDEAAVSQQAKEVISWCSQIAQKKPGDKILLQDIPGHFTEIMIHKDFHLIITGNDPNSTLNRKELPKQVLDFAYKIIYPQTKKREDIIKITKKMIANQTSLVNQELAEVIGNFHYELSQKFESTTQRDILKLVRLLGKNIQNIKTDSTQYKKAIYYTYFSKYSQVEQYKFKLDSAYKKYFLNSENPSQKIKNFHEEIEMMSSNRLPLLILYEPLSKFQLIQNVKFKYPKIHIYKCMTCYTQQNLLGGYTSDQNGKMCFKLTGLGRFLVENQEQLNNLPPTQVLMCDIHLINEGVRTQLNQFLQQGYIYINNKKYYWPKNLRLIFTIPIEKIDQLSQPYQSRHLQIKYIAANPTISASFKVQQAQYIEKQLDKSQKLKVINLFSQEIQMEEALYQYRRNNKNRYFKLVVSEDMQEVDWMGSMTKERDVFETKLLGLYKHLSIQNSVIEIIGLDNNISLLNVIQSLLMMNWTENDFIQTMIPKLDQIKVMPTTLIINSNVRANQLMPLMNQWKGVQYINVIKNITVNTSKFDQYYFNFIRKTQAQDHLDDLNQATDGINPYINYNNDLLMFPNNSELNTQAQRDFCRTSFDKVKPIESKIIQQGNDSRLLFQRNTIEAAQNSKFNFDKNQLQTEQIKHKTLTMNFKLHQIKQDNQDNQIQNAIQVFKAIELLNDMQVSQNQQLSINSSKLKEEEQARDLQKQQQDQYITKLNFKKLKTTIQSLTKNLKGNFDNDEWIDSYWQNQGYFISVKNGIFQINQLIYNLSQEKFQILKSKQITQLQLSIKKQHLIQTQKNVTESEPNQQFQEFEEKMEETNEMMERENFTNQQNINDIDQFSKFLSCLSDLKNLQILDVDFSSCDHIQDSGICYLFQALQNLEKINSFTLNLAGCNKLTGQTIRYLKFFIEQKERLKFSINLCGTNLIQREILQIQRFQSRIRSFYGCIKWSSYQLMNLRRKIRLYGLEITFPENETIDKMKQALNKAALYCVGLSSIRIILNSQKIEINQDFFIIVFDILKNEFKYLRNASMIFNPKQHSNSQQILQSLIPEPTLYDERKYFLLFMVQLIWNQINNDYLQEAMKDAFQISQFGSNKNIFGRKSLRTLPNNHIELLLDFDEWHSLIIFDDKNLFQIKQFLQFKSNYQPMLGQKKGYWNIIIKLIKWNSLLKLQDVQHFISRLIRRYEEDNRPHETDKFKWDVQKCIHFFQILNQEFYQYKSQHIWKLQSCIKSLKQCLPLQYHDRFMEQEIQHDLEDENNQNLDGFLEKVYSKLQPIYVHAYEQIKQESIMPKSHWLNYVSGETKQKVVSKSGKFSFQRFIQNKKPFYYRSEKTQGDIELNKKYEKDYDEFLKVTTDQKIDSLLSGNPKLIYCFKHYVLKILIEQNNPRVWKCIQKTKQLHKRLPINIQKVIDDKLKENERKGRKNY